MNTHKHTLPLLVAAALTGCTGAAMMTTPTGGTAATETTRETPFVPGVIVTGGTAGGVINTFHHPDAIDGTRPLDVREALTRMAEEGPPAYRSHVHGCRKMRYRSMGRMLDGLGVDLASDAPLSAGRMWREADQALGAPNYGARIPETSELTTASASRLFDILVQAAPEIMANIGSEERCQIGGRGVTVFAADGSCDRDGLTCLLGEPASAEHLALCNLIVDRASDPEKGRVIAIASMLAAASTCE